MKIKTFPIIAVTIVWVINVLIQRNHPTGLCHSRLLNTNMVLRLDFKYFLQ